MKKFTFKHRIVAAMPLITLTIYLFLGFQFDGMWGKGLLVFLLIPATPFLVGLKKFNLTFSTFILLSYVVLGIIFGSDWWHPGWLIFFLIPIVGILREGKKDSESTFKN